MPIFSRRLVSKYPPLKRMFGRFLRKRPRRQIEDTIRICLDKVSLNPEKSNHLQLSKPGKKYGSKIIEADGYVDNSPLRSELTTYPQPLLPGQGKEEDTDEVRSRWVIHKQPPADLYLGNPSCSCVWITPRKDDGNRSKVVRVSSNKPLTQSCHFDISVTEEIG